MGHEKERQTTSALVDDQQTSPQHCQVEVPAEGSSQEAQEGSNLAESLEEDKEGMGAAQIHSMSCGTPEH